MYFNNPDEVTRDATDEITDEDLQDMFNVLKKQKKGIDVLTSSVNESTRQLMVIEREINLGSARYANRVTE